MSERLTLEEVCCLLLTSLSVALHHALTDLPSGMQGINQLGSGIRNLWKVSENMEE